MITEKDIQLCGSDDCKLVAGISLVVVERLKQELKDKCRSHTLYPLLNDMDIIEQIDKLADDVFKVEGEK